MLDEDKDSNNFTAAVGDYVVFNCHLDFPHEIPIPYILHWNREVSIRSFIYIYIYISHIYIEIDTNRFKKSVVDFL